MHVKINANVLMVAVLILLSIKQCHQKHTYMVFHMNTTKIRYKNTVSMVQAIVMYLIELIVAGLDKDNSKLSFAT